MSSALWSLLTEGEFLGSYLFCCIHKFYKSLAMVIFSMMGSDPSPTNYPGKIPAGLDAPSDIGDVNDSEDRVSNSHST